jgi:hypothetical protein
MEKQLIQCSVESENGERCSRKFKPGAGGGNGKCQMHLMREKRDSPNKDVPGYVRDGSHTEQLTTYVDADTMTRIRLLAKSKEKTVSSWLREMAEREVGTFKPQ